MASHVTAQPFAIAQEERAKRKYTLKMRKNIQIPDPSIDQVEVYLEKWNGLENYRLQEEALNAHGM